MTTAVWVLAALGVATAASWLLTPPAARLGRRLGLVDHPSDRRVKARPIPTSGGIVVFGSFAASMVVILGLNGDAAPALALKLLALLLGGTVILGLGMADDKHCLKPRVKLLVQAAVSVAMVLSNVGIHRIRLFFGPSVELGWLSYPVTIFWFMGCMNALNMIDGLDGLASGIVAITSGALLVFGVGGENPLFTLMCASLLGSTVGFLLHNFPKGNVYLGDCGSMVLGFFLAGAAIAGAANDIASKSLLIAAACMAVPAFDVATSVARRLRSRSGVMTADQAHVHHRLIRFGLSPKMAVVVLWGVTIFFGGQMLGLVSDHGIVYILGSYAVAAVVLNILKNQRRKNLKTTKRDLKDEVFYLIGARDSVDGETAESEAGLRQIIVEQTKREALYRRLVREERPSSLPAAGLRPETSAEEPAVSERHAERPRERVGIGEEKPDRR